MTVDVHSVSGESSDRAHVHDDVRVIDDIDDNDDEAAGNDTTVGCSELLVGDVVSSGEQSSAVARELSDLFDSTSVLMRATHPWQAEDQSQLHAEESQCLRCLPDTLDEGWIFAKSLDGGTDGWLPVSYLEDVVPP